VTAGGARLRVALVAGTLAQGGAEKQLVYTVRALREEGADVRVYSLTRGEFHEPALRALGVDPVWIGRFGNPALRTTALAFALRSFRPHIVQSSHFYTNLYVWLVAPLFGAISIGTVRSDVEHEMRTNGRWGKLLLRTPAALILNSHAAQRNALALAIPADSMHVLPNAIDLDDFDARASSGAKAGDRDQQPPVAVEESVVIGVGSLVTAKRFDRFIRALALARAAGSSVRGVIVGDGPERAALETLAQELGLLPGALSFAGRRDDVPALLSRAQIYLLSSEHEGFPNVLLEAMAARLPVVTTPAGDAGIVVEDGSTGFVVAMHDVETMAARLAELAASPELRERMGKAGRRRVEVSYTCGAMRARIAVLHRAIATRLGNRRSLAALESV
jgi:glycosyltransferase involved in cell wall biosynthesis